MRMNKRGVEILNAYLELTKPRILTMVLVTAAVGFFFGEQGIHSYYLFTLMLLGTGLSCAGAAALNHYLEREVDSYMQRTCKRPIPSGLISSQNALYFGLLLILLGVGILVAKVNLLSGFLSLLTSFLYVLVYTPLKRVTWLNTTIGAIPGALPPMGGWAAATGHLGVEAWILFAIIFLWQHPHFYAIAWMYKDDYARGGFKMLPVVDPDGRSTFHQIIIFSLLLLPVSLMPTVVGMAGQFYLLGILALGIFMLVFGFTLLSSGAVMDARKLLRASVIYLPMWLVLIIMDRGF